MRRFSRTVNQADTLADAFCRIRNRREFIQGTLFPAAAVVLAQEFVALPAAEAADLQITRRPSAEAQKRVGRQAARQILAHYPEVHDSRADQFRNMGQRLVAALSDDERKTWDFDFHVLESKQVNAFALPGGPMFMFTGLANILTSLDALAGVTGHEMTHVRKEHWAKAYQQQQSRGLLLGLGLTIFKAGSAAQTLAGVADNAIGKKYSRGEEDEADAGGLQNMVDAGFNPQGMVELFLALQKISGNGGGVGGDFLKDHPLTSERIKKSSERIAAYGPRTFPPLTPLHFAPPGASQPLTPPVAPTTTAPVPTPTTP